jgi:hypothetical protein
MDYKGLYGKAKKKFQDLGEGDKDLLETMEGGGSLDVVGNEKTDERNEYKRGEDMVADIERDMEISKSLRKKKAESGDDFLDDLNDF